jgi:hypothetical protein
VGGIPLLTPVVAVERSTPSPASGLMWDTFSSAAIDDAGKVAFVADGFTNFNTGGAIPSIWSNRPGSLTLVVRKDDMPGRVGAMLSGMPSGFERFLVNRGGDVAFGTTQYDSTAADRDGVWRWNGSGALQTVAREADAPPAALGTSYQVVLHTLASLNDQGTIQFRATGNAPGPSGNQTAMLRQTPPGTAAIVALNNQSVGSYTTFGPGFNGINNEGQSAYGGLLVGGITQYGIALRHNSGGGQVVARSTDPAAGATGANYVFNFAPSTLLTGAGTVAFTANLSGSGVVSGVNDAALWVGAPGNVKMLARRGDQAPGAPAGFKWTSFGAMSASADGDLLFRATISDGATSSAGLWVNTFEGALLPVIRAGDQVDTDPGTGVMTRTVKDFFFAEGSGGEDGMPSPLSASGFLALKLQFTDDSAGIFVTSVPEPALGLGGAGAIAMTALRRRRARCR